MASVVISVATLAAGALLGFISTIYVTVVKHRHEVVVRIIDQYFEIRNELAGEVSHLTFLKMEEPLSEPTRFDLQTTVSRLYYKHYDFLPMSVLDSLTILRVTLERYDGRVYGIDDRTVRVLTKEETAEVIERSSDYTNGKLFTPFGLVSGESHRRANEAVRLQARNVLSTLNANMSLDDLMSIAKTLRKSN